ncbi:MAG TPA: PH domain-containing protein [Candidatus Saccharimonadales bacterium]|nr:PH domain-containing protein [Candidatus Saccharimonadales bacterium]
MAEDATEEEKNPHQFEGQYDDEEVLLVFRRHPVAMRKGLYLLLILTALGALPVLFAPLNMQSYGVFVGAFVLGCIGLFYHWIGWYFSVFVITNLRFRQTIQRGFFGRSVVDVGLNKIQNISYNINGFTASMFGFGTIIVQTYVGDLVLDKVPHPDRIYSELHKIIKENGGQDLDETTQD